MKITVNVYFIMSSTVRYQLTIRTLHTTQSVSHCRDIDDNSQRLSIECH